MSPLPFYEINRAANKKQVHKLGQSQLLPVKDSTLESPFFRQHYGPHSSLINYPSLPTSLSFTNQQAPGILYPKRPSHPKFYWRPVKSSSQTLLHQNPPTIPSYSYPSQSQAPLHTLPAPCAQDAVDWFWPPSVICQSKSNLPPPRKFPLPFPSTFLPSHLPLSSLPKILPIQLLLTLYPRNPASGPFILSLVPTLPVWLRSEAFCI